jgi:CheY-like chemotaxis protein
VVDDNPGFRARARRWLEADGFTVVAEAEDGASALDAVRNHRPAVVLLDVQLPDVERHVTAIFGKLGLPTSGEDHRRVLAVLAFLRG